MNGIQLGLDAFLAHDEGAENSSGPLAMSMVGAASVLRRVYCWAGFSVLVEAGSISVVANGALRKFVFFDGVDLPVSCMLLRRILRSVLQGASSFEPNQQNRRDRPGSGETILIIT